MATGSGASWPRGGRLAGEPAERGADCCGVLVQVFELGGDVVPDDMAYGVMRLIAEGAGQDDPVAMKDLRSQAVASYLRLLHKPNLPDVLLKVGPPCPHALGGRSNARVRWKPPLLLPL